MSVDWSEERPTLALLKETITVPDVLDMLGVEVNSQGKFASPWRPDERTPSAHAYEDHWYDFGAGKGGDVIDLARAFQPDLTVSQALFKLWNKALRSGREPGDVEKQPVRTLIDFTDTFPFRPEDPSYLLHWERVLGVPVPTSCRVLDGDLLIPHADQNGIYGVKVRQRGGGKSSWTGSQFGHKLYNPWSWGEFSPWPRCILAEGESDSWALISVMNDVEILALPSGAGTWRDSWLEDLKVFDKVWLCMDNDRSGEQARDKLTSKIGYLRCEQLRVPPLYNDAREAIVAGWRPELPGS